VNLIIKCEFANISSLRFNIEGSEINLEVDLNVRSWFNVKFKLIENIKAEFKRIKNLKSLRE